jgi:uncharacterized repeat protein (TIGR01451 family)
MVRKVGQSWYAWRTALGRTLLALALLSGVTGCPGVTQNPSYFPFLSPTGDIVRTHAKPIFGYFHDFDPHACRLEVRPIESTNPVQTQHLLIATVYDEKGEPRRHRRVEWMLEGVGNIVEVDESGLFPGRGYKVDNKYAVSYTDTCEHHFDRGNCDPNDDFVIRPGQTWCVITSAVEGDTHVTVYAPEIYDWDHHKVFVTKHWVDAEWRMPPPAVNRCGTEHVFTTQIYRHTDHEPLANYRVRYRIIDGPPAFFMPGHAQEAVALSDLNGNANVTLAQASPIVGVNRISVEIIRPPDPCAPSGSVGIVIGRGETTKEWQGPHVTLSKAVPPSVVIGQEVPYTITVTNNGQVETQTLTVRDVVPEGLQYVRSDPPASVEGKDLVWALAPLAPGKNHEIHANFVAQRTGPIVNCATVTGPEGLRDEKCVTTQITRPELSVTKTGPANGVVGVPIPYTITVTNPGTGPASHVALIDEFDEGLEHDSHVRKVQLEIGDLAAGESKSVALNLMPRTTGQLVNRVTATADGNLTATAQHTVNVQRAQLRIAKTGPSKRYVGRPAEWNIRVDNPGEVALTNVVVRDQLPPELSFVSATQQGAFADGQVVWNVGVLQPGEQRIVQVTTKCEKMTPKALNVAVASADPGLQVQAEADVEILGLPAFRLEVDDTEDPVEVGGQTSYRIVVTNQGSLPGNQVDIQAVVPRAMRFVKATGPSAYTIEELPDGQHKVHFAPVESLPQGQQINYEIFVEALTPGDIRFHTELRSATLKDPVIEEESTTIWKPPAINRPAGAAPPAAGTPPGTPPSTSPPALAPGGATAPAATSPGTPAATSAPPAASISRPVQSIP